ncbi:MAG TPA: hypothetical protein DF712_19745 [Balneola sp.]|jgi:hypothetical protein|nr:hypothetical protein [Bacteroidota bacterium]HCT54683.1 hypothetical protein [Balneola sp.]|tara:strand:- start:3219 stop:3482 length:264 start_codon:yes stop_codon:yes gene_type:complete
MSHVDSKNFEYRQKVADLATDVIDGELDFFDFLNEIGGEESVYETGDEEVDKLIDLLEHQPISSSKIYEEYLSRIKKSINNLKAPVV